MTESLIAVLELGAWLACLALVLNGFSLLVTAWYIRRGTATQERIRLPDAPIPEPLAAIESEIRALGFIPQRHTQHRIILRRARSEVWTYNHTELHIEIAVTPSPTRPPFFISLETQFPDGALLVTTYPRGFSSDAPRLMVRYAEHSLKDAFDHHLLTQLQWTEEHGEPIPPVDEDAAYFAAANAAAVRHSRGLFNPIVRQHVGQGIARFGFALILIYFVFSLRPVEEIAAIGLTESFNLIFLMLIGILLAAIGSAYSVGGKKSVAVDADSAPQIDPNLHPLHRPERNI